MHSGTISREMSRKLVDSLYVEAMVMADEARAYFDSQGDLDRDSLEIMARVSFSCESLKVTTRLMHIIAWLLTQRAIHNGELRGSDLSDPQHQLGASAKSDPEVVARFPFAARALIDASQDLYDRVARLQNSLETGRGGMPHVAASPARQLLHRLESSF
jgi:regulator of CtrA degradation